MTEAIPIPIASKPGCKKDGTILEGDFHVETIWTGFNERGLPEKMGGYQQVTSNLSDICRGLHIYSRNNFNFVHAGSADNFERLTIQNDTGAATGVINRTPAGFAADDDNIWQIDAMFNSNSSVTQIIAHATPSLLDISVETASPIYVGDITSTAILTQVSAPATGNPTGGIVVLHPYLFYYGANGIVGWSVANTPTDLSGAGSGAARVTESKVVKGLPLRGGPGNAPSGLFWALNELVRISFIGGASIFQADTLSSTISILSPAAIIEDDGIYYWPGIDRFFVFNGVVRELVNPYNRQFFFNNLNYAYRTSVFATKVTSRGEIWFCFPFGSSTVCNHAVIYNKRLNCWYDTPLPNGGRSAGVWAQVYRYSLMTGAVPVADKSRLWQHEMAQPDEIVGTTTNAVMAAFETGEKSFALPPGGTPNNKAMSVVRVEPDFVQSGPMQMIVRGRPNCRAPDQSSDAMTFQATNATVDINAATGAADGDQFVNPKATRRLLRFRFESNIAGGNFQAGTILASIQPGDGRGTA